MGRSIRRAASEVFRWPCFLGILMAVGLASALFGNDGWDVLSWLAMAVPLAVIAWMALVR